MDSFALVGILWFGIWAAVLGVWIWSLVDAIKTPDSTWQAAGQSKILWILLLVFLGIIGSILYFLIPRKALLAANE